MSNSFSTRSEWIVSGFDTSTYSLTCELALILLDNYHMMLLARRCLTDGLQSSLRALGSLGSRCTHGRLALNGEDL